MQDRNFSIDHLSKLKLDCEEAVEIVEQALAMIEHTYVHREQKEATYAFSAVQRLRLLRDEIHRDPTDAVSPQGMGRSRGSGTGGHNGQRAIRALDFHREMTEIFLSLRDLHTSYLLPKPFRNHVAYLPFLVEVCGPPRNEQFLVTRLLGSSIRDPHFKKGVEILHWNGVPIRRAVDMVGERQAGANGDARFALGLQALTVRPLIRSLPPDEDWVTVTYRLLKGKEREVRLRWLVSNTRTLPKPDKVPTVARVSASAGFGMDLHGALIGETRHKLFERKRRKGDLTSDLQMLWARPIAGGRYGYLRIFSFDAPSADGFVDTVRGLLSKLPKEGLIIDLRGNPGGNIAAAERLLQLFSPRRIRPMGMQFVNSRVVLKLCEIHEETNAPGLFLKPWIPSIGTSLQTGSSHSSAFPLTEEFDANEIGQCYYGPVLLITDSRCYSAADIFAAGFQDHAIGNVLGVRGQTGAGGANVWHHSLLTALLHGAENLPLKPLGDGTGMTVAIRRALRNGSNSGALLEDFGVVSDYPYYRMTRRDILEGNEDLLEKAVSLLDAMRRKQPARALQISKVLLRGSDLQFTLETINLRRVDLFLDNVPVGAKGVRNGRSLQTIAVGRRVPRRVRVLGFASVNGAEPVASAFARI